MTRARKSRWAISSAFGLTFRRCPLASRTTKQASVSSAIQGGGKRRGSGLSIIALSLTRDCKPRQAKGALGT